MNNVINFPDRSRIQEQACYWLVKLDGGELSREDDRAFRDWLSTDPMYGQVIMELSTLWDNMDVLSELSDLFPLAKKQAPAPKKFSPVFSMPVMAVTAVFAMTLWITAFLNTELFHRHAGDQPRLETTYQTDVGEQINIVLPDGSDTKLNTDSLVQVAYGDNQRNIRLVKGEAHFKVVHDRDRPFVVYAGTGAVRAVGTAFSVRLRGDDVEVTVTEGRVEIAASGEAGSGRIINFDKTPPGKVLTTLTEGQSAEFGGGNIHSVETIRPEIIERKLSWRHGMLIFEGDPLEQVVEEISRYTSTRIVITDPGIREIRIGGYFRAGETEALLAVLEQSFGINIERENTGLIYLTGVTLTQAGK